MVLLLLKSIYLFLLLLDFGFAQYLQSDSEAQTIRGSPLYMVRGILSKGDRTSCNKLAVTFPHMQAPCVVCTSFKSTKLFRSSWPRVSQNVQIKGSLSPPQV